MRCLLDTCALVWLGMGGGGLGEGARRMISNAQSLNYSAISSWEIARLQKECKVVIPNTPDGFLADLAQQYGIESIPPTDDIMIRAAQLPEYHRDPADRIIIATALVHSLPVVTGDGKFAQYGVQVIS